MLTLFFSFLAIISMAFMGGSGIIGILYGVYLVMHGSTFASALFYGGITFIGVLSFSFVSYVSSLALAMTFKD